MTRQLTAQSIAEIHDLRSAAPFLILIEVDTDPSDADSDKFRLTKWPSPEEMDDPDYLEREGTWTFEGVRYPLPGWTLDSSEGEGTGAPSGDPADGNGTLYFQTDGSPVTHSDSNLRVGTRDGTDGLFHVYSDGNLFGLSEGWHEVNKGYVTATEPGRETETPDFNPDSSDDLALIIALDDSIEVAKGIIYNSSTGASWDNSQGATEQLTYTGPVYTAAPFEIGDVQRESDGGLPRLTVRVDNTGQLLTSDIDSASGGRTSDGTPWEVTLRVVNTLALNRFDQSDPDIEEVYSVMSTKITDEWVEMEVGAESILKMRWPPRTYSTVVFPGIPADLN